MKSHPIMQGKISERINDRGIWHILLTPCNWKSVNLIAGPLYVFPLDLEPVPEDILTVALIFAVYLSLNFLSRYIA